MEQLPEINHWIDSGEAIARRVHSLLTQGEVPATPDCDNVALFTRVDPSIDALRPALARMQLAKVQALRLTLLS